MITVKSERTEINAHIFDYIYELALRDATTRVLRKGEKAILSENDRIKELVKEYAEGIINGDGTDFYITAREIEDLRGEIDDFTFGNIQKLINMTMKYLYVKYYDNAAIRDRFEKCHAPMDGIMRDFVYRKYRTLFGEKPQFDYDLAWSNLLENDKKKYEAYQEAVKKIIKKENKKMIPIEFDYVAWGKDPDEELEQF